MTKPPHTPGTPETPISVETLHAFVDGLLGPEEMARVEAFLEQNPQAADDVAAWDAQNAAINEIFAAVTPADETKPGQAQATPAPQTTSRANTAPQTAPRTASTTAQHQRPTAANLPRAPGIGMLAASLGVLAIGLAGGWTLRGVQPGQDLEMTAELVGEAIAAHVVYAADPHRPVEIGASEEELMLRWLSARVGKPLAAPDLSADGFDLVGGRLLSVSEGPAAQFMYENAAGARITLFAVQSAPGRLAQNTAGGSSEAEFSHTSDGTTQSFYWQDENLRYALTGDVSRDVINQLAVAVFAQLATG